jgi:hypothetical protein
MDEKYLDELWKWTNSVDPTFKDRYTFDSWSEKIGSDEKYQSTFYKWVESKDKSFSKRRPYQDWVQLVKKKDETTVSSGQDQDTPTTLDTETQTEQPVSDTSDTQIPTASGAEINQIQEQVDPQQTDGVGEVISPPTPSQEGEGMTEDVEDVAPGEFSPDKTKFTTIISTGVNRDTGKMGPDMSVTVGDEVFDMSYDYETKTKGLGGYLKEKLSRGLFKEETTGKEEYYENLDDPEVRTSVITEMTQIGATDLEESTINRIARSEDGKTYIDEDKYLSNLNKRMPMSEAQNLVQDKKKEALRNINSEITHQGTYYMSDTEKEISHSFDEYQYSEDTLVDMMTALQEFDEFPEEKRNAILARDPEYRDKLDENIKNQGVILTTQQMRYAELSGSDREDALYSPKTGKLINYKDATQKDKDWNEGLSERAEAMAALVGNDVNKLEDQRRATYFELLYLAKKLGEGKNFVNAVTEGTSSWDIIKGQLFYAYETLRPQIIPEGEDPKEWAEKSKKEAKKFLRGGEVEGEYNWVKNIPVDDSYKFEGELGFMKSDSPLAQVYNSKLEQFIVANKALVLNKDFLLDAQVNPGTEGEAFYRGFQKGMDRTGLDTKSPTDIAQTQIEILKQSGFTVTPEQEKRIKAGMELELLEEGGSLIPFLWELTGGRYFLGSGGAGLVGEEGLITKTFQNVGMKYDSPLWRGGVKIIGGAFEEGLVMGTSATAFDQEGMGLRQGVVLGGSTTAGGLLFGQLNRIPLLKNAYSLIKTAIDAQIKIASGMVGMTADHIVTNLADENMGVGEAINEAFGGDDKLTNAMKLYILTAGMGMTKPGEISTKWRRSLLNDIKGRYGRKYMSLPPSIRSKYETLGVRGDASMEDVFDAFQKKTGPESKYYNTRDLNENQKKELVEISEAYLDITTHNEVKEQMKQAIAEADRLQAQEDAKVDRENKTNEVIQNVKEPTQTTQKNLEGKSTITFDTRAGDPLSFETAQYYGELTPTEQTAVQKQIEQQVADGDISKAEGEAALNKIQKAAQRYNSLKTAKNKKQREQAYNLLNERDVLQKELDALEGQVLGGNEKQQIQDKIDGIDKTIEDFNKEDIIDPEEVDKGQRTYTGERDAQGRPISESVTEQTSASEKKKPSEAVELNTKTSVEEVKLKIETARKEIIEDTKKLKAELDKGTPTDDLAKMKHISKVSELEGKINNNKRVIELKDELLSNAKKKDAKKKDAKKKQAETPTTEVTENIDILNKLQGRKDDILKNNQELSKAQEKELSDIDAEMTSIITEGKTNEELIELSKSDDLQNLPDVQIKLENQTTPSKITHLPEEIELIHLSKKQKDISSDVDVSDISTDDKYGGGDSFVDGLYLSDSPLWNEGNKARLPNYEGANKVKIKNDGLIFFNDGIEFERYVKEKYAKELEGLGGVEFSKKVKELLIKDGVKGVLSKSFDNWANELVVLDPSIIISSESSSNTPGRYNPELYKGTTRLPRSVDAAKQEQRVKEEAPTTEVAKEPKPTEIPSKEQAPSAKTDTKKQSQTEPQEPTAESDKKADREKELRENLGKPKEFKGQWREKKPFPEYDYVPGKRGKESSKLEAKDNEPLQDVFNDIENGIISDTPFEKRTKEQLDASLDKLINSEWYNEANDTSKENAFRKVLERFKVRQPRSPKTTFEYDPKTEKIYNDIELLKEQLRAHERGGKDLDKIVTKLIKYIDTKVKSRTPYTAETKWTPGEIKKLYAKLKGLSKIERGKKPIAIEKVKEEGKKRKTDQVKELDKILEEIDSLVETKLAKTAISYIRGELDLSKEVTKGGKGKLPIEVQNELRRIKNEELKEERLEDKTLRELEELAQYIKNLKKDGTVDQAEKRQRERRAKIKSRGASTKAILTKAKAPSKVFEGNEKQKRAQAGTQLNKPKIKIEQALKKLDLTKGDEPVSPGSETTIDERIKSVQQEIQEKSDNYKAKKEKGEEISLEDKLKHLDEIKTLQGEVRALNDKKYSPPTLKELGERQQEIQSDIENNKGISEEERADQEEKLNKAVETIEDRIYQDEADANVDPNKFNPVVIVTNAEGETFAINSSQDLKLLEGDEFVDVTGYSAPTGKKVPIRKATDLNSWGLSGMQNLKTLLQSIPKGDKVLWEKQKALMAKVVEAERNMMLGARELGKKVNKARKDAGLSSTKLGSTKSKGMTGVSTKGIDKEGIEISNDTAVYMWMMTKVNGSETNGKWKSKRVENSNINVSKLQAYMELPENQNLRDYADNLFKFYEETTKKYKPMIEEYMGRSLEAYDVDPITGEKRPYAPVLGKERLDILDDSGNMAGLDATNATDRRSNTLSDRMKARNDKWQIEYDPETGKAASSERNLGPIKRIGATNVAYDYISSMERAEHMTPVNEAAKDLMNSTTKGSLQKILGRGRYTNLERTIDRVVLGEQPIKSDAERGISVVNRIATIFAIGFKIENAVKQAVSMTHWYGAGLKYGLGALSYDAVAKANVEMFTTAENRKIIYDVLTSPELAERYFPSKGGVGIDPEFSKSLAKLKETGWAGKDAAAYMRSFVTKFALLPTLTGDAIGVLGGGLPFTVAMYKHYKKQGMSPEKAKEEAQKAFYNEMTTVQQSSLESAKSEVQANTLNRVFFATFKTAQIQGVNKQHQAIQALRNWKNLTNQERSQAVHDAIYWSSFNAGFAAITSGWLATSTSDLDEGVEGEERRRVEEKVDYDFLMSTARGYVEGLGAIGYLAESALNVLEDKEFFNSMPVAFEMMGKAFMAPFDIADAKEDLANLDPTEEDLEYKKSIEDAADPINKALEVLGLTKKKRDKLIGILTAQEEMLKVFANQKKSNRDFYQQVDNKIFTLKWPSFMPDGVANKPIFSHFDDDGEVVPYSYSGEKKD